MLQILKSSFLRSLALALMRLSPQEQVALSVAQGFVDSRQCDKFVLELNGLTKEKKTI